MNERASELESRGARCAKAGDAAGAVEAYRAALEIRRALPDETIELARVSRHLGVVLTTARALEEARVLLERAEELARTALPAGDLELSFFTKVRGDERRVAGDAAAAQALFQRAQDEHLTRLRTLGPQLVYDSLLHEIVGALASSAEAAGDLDAAARAHTRAVEAGRGGSMFDAARSSIRAGAFAHRRGDDRAAKQHAEAALPWVAATMPKPGLPFGGAETTELLTELAALLDALTDARAGRCREAIAALDRARSAPPRASRPWGLVVAITLVLLALAFLAMMRVQPEHVSEPRGLPSSP